MSEIQSCDFHIMFSFEYNYAYILSFYPSYKFVVNKQNKNIIYFQTCTVVSTYDEPSTDLRLHLCRTLDLVPFNTLSTHMEFFS